MLKVDKAARMGGLQGCHAIPELESYGLAKFDEFYEQRRAKLRERLLGPDYRVLKVITGPGVLPSNDVRATVWSAKTGSDVSLA